MRMPIKKTLRLVIALVFLVIGLAGLVLPLLNGFLFILAALLILSLEVPSLEARLDIYGRKNPRIELWYDRCKAFIKKYF